MGRVLRVVLYVTVALAGCARPCAEPATVPGRAAPGGPEAPPRASAGDTTTVGACPSSPSPPEADDPTGTLANVATAGHQYYRRSLYGKGWLDLDGDCQNTRDEVLIAESLVPVEFESRSDGRSCKVTRGLWLDPFALDGSPDPRVVPANGAPSADTVRGYFTRAQDVDVDHFVPLQNAHDSGGDSWTQAERAAYANDLTFPKTLRAVGRSTNRAKGARDPSRWMPPNRASWCAYLRDWRDVKRHYRLSMKDDERRAFIAHYQEAHCTFE